MATSLDTLYRKALAAAKAGGSRATESGKYLTLVEGEKSLKIVPTPEGREEAKERLEDLAGRKKGIDQILWELMEDITSNSGWRLIKGDDIGAMTEAPVLSNELLETENGDIVLSGRIYFYGKYATHNEIEDLAEGKTVTFDAHGKHLTKATLKEYDELRDEDYAGKDPDWKAFTKKWVKEYE